jgi:Na+/serine symporter
VTIGSAVTVITSIRSKFTVVEALVTVLVIIVATLGLLGLGGYSKGTLQLLALSHGMFGVTVKLALVVHDHVEVSFEEGGGSWDLPCRLNQIACTTCFLHRRDLLR